MRIERGIQVDHSTIMRWVHQYSPEIEKRIRRHLRPTNDLWRVDETYIKVKGKWKYLYRAVDSDGDTIDFMLISKRNRKAAKRFFKKALSSNHNQIPRVITVDKNPAYPPAIDKLKNDKIRFWCKKSGFVAKSMKNFTIREFNQYNQGKNDTQR